MKTVNKYDTKRTVKELLESFALVQKDMADELGITEGYLSQLLSPAYEVDGPVYGYLRPMGYLADKKPEAFNAINTFVQRIVTDWQSPVLAEDRGPHVFIMELHHLSSQVIDGVLARKSEQEIRTRLTLLAACVADFQRSMSSGRRFRPEAVNSLESRRG